MEWSVSALVASVRTSGLVKWFHTSIKCTWVAVVCLNMVDIP
jgi:hypothetical protein